MRPPRALAARGALLGASGGVAAGLAVRPAVTALRPAAALWPVRRGGPRARLKCGAPAGIEAAAWIVGLYVAAGAVAALVFRLETRPRMPPALKALNVAL